MAKEQKQNEKTATAQVSSTRAANAAKTVSGASSSAKKASTSKSIVKNVGGISGLFIGAQEPADLDLSLSAAVAGLQGLSNGFENAYNAYMLLAEQYKALPEDTRSEKQQELAALLLSNTFMIHLGKSSRLASEAGTYRATDENLAERVAGISTASLAAFLVKYKLADHLGALELAAARDDLQDNIKDDVAGLKATLEAAVTDLKSLRQCLIDMISAADKTDNVARTELVAVRETLATYTTDAQKLVTAAGDASAAISTALSVSELQFRAELNKVVPLLEALVTATNLWTTTFPGKQNDTGRDLATQLRALRTWLWNKLDAFNKDLLELALTPVYKKLSFKVNWVYCSDRQDPWTQSSQDRIYLAWIAIGPDGVVHSDTMPIGRFDEKEDRSLEKTFNVHTFDLDTDPTFKKLYLVFPALFERDGDKDLDDKWKTVVDAVKSMVSKGLKERDYEEDISSWLDAQKEKIQDEIKSSVWNWNEDDLLGISARYTWRGTILDLYTPTPRKDIEEMFAENPAYAVIQTGSMSDDKLRQTAISCRMNVKTLTQSYRTDTYANDPKDPTVGEGKYRVQASWTYHN